MVTALIQYQQNLQTPHAVQQQQVLVPNIYLHSVYNPTEAARLQAPTQTQQPVREAGYYYQPQAANSTTTGTRAVLSSVI